MIKAFIIALINLIFVAPLFVAAGIVEYGVISVIVLVGITYLGNKKVTHVERQVEIAEGQDKTVRG